MAKKEVYAAVLAALDTKLQESGMNNCLRIVDRYLDLERRDVISVCCMKNDVGNVMSDVDSVKDIWRNYMGKLLNVENEWVVLMIWGRVVSFLKKKFLQLLMDLKLEKQLVLLV